MKTEEPIATNLLKSHKKQSRKMIVRLKHFIPPESVQIKKLL